MPTYETCQTQCLSEGWMNKMYEMWEDKDYILEWCWTFVVNGFGFIVSTVNCDLFHYCGFYDIHKKKKMQFLWLKSAFASLTVKQT